MTDFAQMHIFFLVTTVTVAILGLLLAFIFFRVYRILTDVEQISHEFSEESKLMREDIADLRKNVREKGLKFKNLFDLYSLTLGRFKRKKHK
ncbi:hypothetical protein HYT05_02055 [Candidatus Kaiserbacteria bacterium]|nr:hypothetical protein [Candidatus Kaiserbacteria bacterium]